MSKAEEKALEKYPAHSVLIVPARGGGYYADSHLREGFIEGYHQAEKDLTDKAKVSSGWDGFYYGQGYKQAEKDNELTWEDVEYIIETYSRVEYSREFVGESYNDVCKEVLKRFNKERKEK